MGLAAGSHLGSYTVVGLLGAGGMGEVYRARDGKLNRDVALKVLPAELARDPDRLARFKREAQVLAALNHPHIAAIHGFEDSDGVHALVLELVEGETLADRIARGPLPLDEALAIARQVAEALEAAHEQGIVHRDLKPANVKVRPDGTVKVLDFGLAKAMEAGTSSRESGVGQTLANSPTITSPVMTVQGVILGTAAYMAPEQARGRAVDKRTDIWAFGAVLYEMLTGIRAFDGEDVSITLAAVLKESPDWSRLPPDTPLAVRRLLTRCLKRDPKERLRDIGDARTEIADLIANPERMDPVAAPSGPEGGSRTARARPWSAVAAALVAMAAAGTAGYLLRPRPPAEVVRFTIGPPDGFAFNMLGGSISGGPGSTAFNGGAISPDGRRIAFTTQDAGRKVQLWVRALDSLAAQPVAGTEGATLPFWSADGRFLAFFANGNLKKVDILGGPPQTLCAAPSGRGGAWSRSGVIVFAPDLNSGLMRVGEAGGESVALTTLRDGETAHRRVSFLPDGRHFLYRASGSIFESGQIILGSLDTGESRPLLAADSQAVYSSGHLLFVRETTLMAQPFDPDSLRLSGTPFPVAEHVATDTRNGLAAFDASPGGVLTYRPGEDRSSGQPTWFDRGGHVLGTVDRPGAYSSLVISPNGTRAVFSRADVQGNIDLWVHELGRGSSTRLTSDPDVDYTPAWSPDGSRIAWSSRRDGVFNIYRRSSNGTGTDEALFKSGDSKFVHDWSPDGNWMLFSSGVVPSVRLFVLSMTGDDPRPQPYAQTGFSESQGRFSPNGRFVAYTSDDTGRPEIYVQAFPTASEGRWKVSEGGGAQPQWRPDGKELFYISADSKLMAVETSVGGTFVPGRPKALFEVPIMGGGQTLILNRYGSTPDGQRFLINTLLSSTGTATPITVVLNWVAGVRR